MKKVNKFSITNIKNTDIFDNIFSLDYLLPTSTHPTFGHLPSTKEGKSNSPLLKREGLGVS